MMDDESDEDDNLDDAFMGELSLSCRKVIVASLLRGNDTQCFTTDQYRKAYQKAFPPPPTMPNLELAKELAEMHLRTLSSLEEVEPGVWIRKEQRHGR